MSGVPGVSPSDDSCLPDPLWRLSERRPSRALRSLAHQHYHCRGRNTQNTMLGALLGHVSLGAHLRRVFSCWHLACFWSRIYADFYTATAQLQEPNGTGPCLAAGKLRKRPDSRLGTWQPTTIALRCSTQLAIGLWPAPLGQQLGERRRAVQRKDDALARMGPAQHLVQLPVERYVEAAHVARCRPHDACLRLGGTCESTGAQNQQHSFCARFAACSTVLYSVR